MAMSCKDHCGAMSCKDHCGAMSCKDHCGAMSCKDHCGPMSYKDHCGAMSCKDHCRAMSCKDHCGAMSYKDHCGAMSCKDHCGAMSCKDHCGAMSYKDHCGAMSCKDHCGAMSYMDHCGAMSCKDHCGAMSCKDHCGAMSCKNHCGAMSYKDHCGAVVQTTLSEVTTAVHACTGDPHAIKTVLVHMAPGNLQCYYTLALPLQKDNQGPRLYSQVAIVYSQWLIEKRFITTSRYDKGGEFLSVFRLVQLRKALLGLNILSILQYMCFICSRVCPLVITSGSSVRRTLWLMLQTKPDAEGWDGRCRKCEHIG